MLGGGRGVAAGPPSAPSCRALFACLLGLLPKSIPCTPVVQVATDVHFPHTHLSASPAASADVCGANWQVHLANKIKYHWKTLLGGWAGLGGGRRERGQGVGSGMSGGWPSGCVCREGWNAAQVSPMLAAHFVRADGGRALWMSLCSMSALSMCIPPRPWLADGSECPFKPDKYFEATHYAGGWGVGSRCSGGGGRG